MRIISGKFKGRIIPVRKNFNARPTTDYAKESLFNILNNNFDFENCSVADLFSGTGGISYEFASRGCLSVISVEKDYRSYDFIKTTSKEFAFGAIKPFKADVFKFLPKCTDRFDIIFADPPYDLKNLDTLPDLVFENDLIDAQGWFILEHGKTHSFSGHNNFKELRVYGSVHFSIFHKK